MTIAASRARLVFAIVVMVLVTPAPLSWGQVQAAARAAAIPAAHTLAAQASGRVTEVVQIDVESAALFAPLARSGTEVPRVGVGGSREENPVDVIYGALYRPAAAIPYTVGVVIVPDFDDRFYSRTLRDLGEGLAVAGYLTLVVNLRRSDHAYDNLPRFERGLEDVHAAIDYLEQWGVRGVYLAGHGYGATEVLQYATWERVYRGAQARVRAVGLYGNYRTQSGLVEYMGMDPADYDEAARRARALLGERREREYLWGPIGASEAEARWAIQARSFWDYVGPVRPDVARLVDDLEELRRDRREGPFPWQTFDGDPTRWAAQTTEWLAMQRGLSLRMARAPGTRPELLREWCPSPDTELVSVVTEDGQRLQGAVYRPRMQAREGEAFVLTHGGGRAFYNGALFWLARCLAERGWTVVAFNRRDFGGQFGLTDFEPGNHDLKAALDYAQTQLGARRLYLLGQSTGTVFATHYLGQTGDERVRALILTGTVADYPAWRRGHTRPEEFAAVEEVAEAAVAADERDRMVFLRWCEVDDRAPQVDGGEWCSDGLQQLTAHTASHFASHFGRRSAAVPRQWIARVQVPVLLLRSEADQVTPCDDSWQVFRHANRSPQVTLIEMNDQVRAADGTIRLAQSRDGHALAHRRITTSNAIAYWLTHEWRSPVDRPAQYSWGQARDGAGAEARDLWDRRGNDPCAHR